MDSPQDKQPERTPANPEPNLAAMNDEQLSSFDPETPSEVEQPQPEVKQPEQQPKTETPVVEPKPENDLKAKLELLEKRLKDKDVMIGRQSNEIGELKRQQQPPKPIEKPSATDFLADPAKAVEDVLQAKKLEEQQLRDQFEEQIKRNREQANQFVPELDNHFEAIKSLLIQEDKLPEDQVKLIFQNPYVLDPAYLVQLGRRATQAQRIKELENRIKELETKPNEMLEQINKATKQATTVKTGGDTTAKKPEYSAKYLANLTDAQLAALEV